MPCSCIPQIVYFSDRIVCCGLLIITRDGLVRSGILFHGEIMFGSSVTAIPGIILRNTMQFFVPFTLKSMFHWWSSNPLPNETTTTNSLRNEHASVAIETDFTFRVFLFMICILSYLYNDVLMYSTELTCIVLHCIWA